MIRAELKAYVNALTNIPLTYIAYNKNGYDRTNLNWNGAHIEDLAIVPTGKSDDFNGDTEVRTLSTSYEGDFIIDFYGDKGLENATTFLNMQNSEVDYEWQRDNSIRISHANRITNIKTYDKGANQDLYQVELKANFTKSTTVTTKRIDTAIHEFLKED